MLFVGKLVLHVHLFSWFQRDVWIFHLDTLLHPCCLSGEGKLGKCENWHTVVCLPATKLRLNPNKIVLLARLGRNQP